MTIRMNCPACKTSINVAEEKRGRKVRCRKCEEIFTVPEVNGKKKRAEESAIQSGRKIKSASPRKQDDDDGDDDRPAKNQKKQPAKTGASGMMLAVGGVAAVLLLCLVGGGGIGAYFVMFRAKPVDAAVAKAADVPENKKQQADDKQPADKVGDKQPVHKDGDKPPIVQVAAIPEGPAPASISPDVVKKVKKSSVYIKVTDATGRTGEGSGFFGLEPGVVITNAHVVGMLAANSKPPKKVEVVVYSGTKDEFKLEGMVLGADRDSDLAVLRLNNVDPSKIPAPLPVESECSLTEVQEVYILGFPMGAGLGKEITVSKSSVSSFRKDVGDGSLGQIQVNGGMTHGNSGGPVVDSRGVVVGVSVAGYDGTQLNFAVPAEKIHGMLHGRVQEIALGEAFFQGKTVKLPVKVSCLDPLARVRELKVDVWTGPAGPARAPD